MILIEVRSSDSLCSTEKYTGIVTYVTPIEACSPRKIIEP